MYLIEPIRNGQYIYDGAVALAIQVHVLNKLNLDEDIIFPILLQTEGADRSFSKCRKRD